MCISMHEGQNNCVKRSTPGVLAHYVVRYLEFFEDEFLIFESIMRNFSVIQFCAALFI